MIELKNVSKAFDGTQALSSIDLKIASQATTVLIGPSGCGKSTLLRLIVGIIRPDRGAILFDRTEIRPENLLKFRQKMGYVIQEGGLFPHLTAYENITLMARYLRWDDVRIEERLRDLASLARFPVEGLPKYPSQLSGGQRQRVSLMRALMLDPDLLLLDEPLGALDPLIRTDLQSDLKDIFKALKKTVVMVTHDLAEAGFFGNLVVVLRGGRIVQSGKFADLIQDTANPFVKRFINAQRWKIDHAGEGTE